MSDLLAGIKAAAEVLYKDNTGDAGRMGNMWHFWRGLCPFLNAPGQQTLWNKIYIPKEPHSWQCRNPAVADVVLLLTLAQVC